MLYFRGWQPQRMCRPGATSSQAALPGESRCPGCPPDGPAQAVGTGGRAQAEAGVRSGLLGLSRRQLRKAKEGNERGGQEL